MTKPQITWKQIPTSELGTVLHRSNASVWDQYFLFTMRLSTSGPISSGSSTSSPFFSGTVGHLLPRSHGKTLQSSWLSSPATRCAWSCPPSTTYLCPTLRRFQSFVFNWILPVLELRSQHRTSQAYTTPSGATLCWAASTWPPWRASLLVAPSHGIPSTRRRTVGLECSTLCLLLCGVLFPSSIGQSWKEDSTPMKSEYFCLGSCAHTSAFLFYVAKLPEILLPGKFDIFGSSHQWWHFIIWACLAYGHHMIFTFAEYRLEIGCE